MIEMELTELRLDESHWNSPQLVVLKEKNGKRKLPMYIGFFEAQALHQKLYHRNTPRPLTYDMITDMVHRLGIFIEQIIIDGVKADTYYAKLVLQSPDGQTVQIDSRPSDALNLALRHDAPIFVDAKLLSPESDTEEQ